MIEARGDPTRTTLSGTLPFPCAPNEPPAPRIFFTRPQHPLLEDIAQHFGYIQAELTRTGLILSLGRFVGPGCPHNRFRHPDVHCELSFGGPRASARNQTLYTPRNKSRETGERRFYDLLLSCNCPEYCNLQAIKLFPPL